MRNLSLLIATVIVGCSSAPVSPPIQDAGVDSPEIIFADTAPHVTEDAGARHVVQPDASCFSSDAVYSEDFTELPESTCGTLFGNMVGGLIVEGTACQTISVSGCQITNQNCTIKGSGLICSIQATATVDGNSGSGTVDLVCNKEFCNPYGICATVDQLSILGGQNYCSAGYTFILTKQ